MRTNRWEELHRRNLIMTEFDVLNDSFAKSDMKDWQKQYFKSMFTLLGSIADQKQKKKDEFQSLLKYSKDLVEYSTSPTTYESKIKRFTAEIRKLQEKEALSIHSDFEILENMAGQFADLMQSLSIVFKEGGSELYEKQKALADLFNHSLKS